MIKNQTRNIDPNKDYPFPTPEEIKKEFYEWENAIKTAKCVRCGFYAKDCQCHTEEKGSLFLVIKNKILAFFNNRKSQDALHEYYKKRIAICENRIDRYMKLDRKLFLRSEGIKECDSIWRI